MKMDFKYIEQLLERYFAAETSLEEESILHDFFRQEVLPEHLKAYRPLFCAAQRLAEARLDDAFDERILLLTGQKHVQAHRITLSQRLRPLFRIAALLVVAAGIGIAVQHGTDRVLPQETAPGFQSTAAVPEDELDPDATTPLDLRADATNTLPDSTLTR